MKKILICLTLLMLGVACQPIKAVNMELEPSPTPIRTGLSTAPVQIPTSRSNQVEIITPFPTQLTEIKPLSATPVVNENSSNWAGDQMPVFLEVTQITIMKKDPARSLSLNIGPTIYFYNQDDKILMLASSIALDAKTDLLIGVINVLQTPDREYTKGEIIQYPSMKPTQIQIRTFDIKTGAITILYEGQEVELAPGESNTFKQVGSDTESLTLITKISNYGHLADIQPTSPDGSWR